MQRTGVRNRDKQVAPLLADEVPGVPLGPQQPAAHYLNGRAALNGPHLWDRRPGRDGETAFSSACASGTERASRDRAPGFRFGAWHPDWMLLRDALGACIRRARLDRGRSLREVAEQAGVSLSHLSADNMPDG